MILNSIFVLNVNHARQRTRVIDRRSNFFFSLLKNKFKKWKKEHTLAWKAIWWNFRLFREIVFISALVIPLLPFSRHFPIKLRDDNFEWRVARGFYTCNSRCKTQRRCSCGFANSPKWQEHSLHARTVQTGNVRNSPARADVARFVHVLTSGIKNLLARCSPRSLASTGPVPAQCRPSAGRYWHCVGLRRWARWHDRTVRRRGNRGMR